MAKAVVFTLGCKVNEVESASLVSGLLERGYEVSDKLGYADLYILNTCAVTGEAEKKSRQLITRAKKYNPNAKIVVCGCAAEKNAEAFLSREGVTLVSGARRKSKILQQLDEEGAYIDGYDKAYDEMPLPAAVKTRHFVKIQDGCNNFCTYCIVPYLRGRSRSRSLESVVNEVKGVNAEETVLTGIDISSYNDGGKDLADLLLALKDMPTRVRLGSLEVGVITERLLKAAATMSDFAPHFHLSLQSGATAVLKKMNRRYTREEYIEKCKLIYRFFPDAAITTDIIAGFPTETEEDFADSLSIIEEVGFAQVHCFVYSPREGTIAAKWKQLSPQVKEERRAKLLQIAEAAKERYIQNFLGKTLTFVPETFDGKYTYGYTENYIRAAVTGEITRKAKIKLLPNENSKEYNIGEVIYE
ncbi:MAG: tRNA (N(6)-L-threonylcarbamoyladenosine(37)-C(2))-methylthiotransferase MtaB [Clostridia bacterium]|nr:tRNA (N(6)-L-threonylcarbamoyladenosine(37)-C(2))-methylthiotransferase MtaB [Clostridia bacterium]